MASRPAYVPQSAPSRLVYTTSNPASVRTVNREDISAHEFFSYLGITAFDRKSLVKIITAGLVPIQQRETFFSTFLQGGYAQSRPAQGHGDPSAGYPSRPQDAHSYTSGYISNCFRIYLN